MAMSTHPVGADDLVKVVWGLALGSGPVDRQVSRVFWRGRLADQDTLLLELDGRRRSLYCRRIPSE